MIVAGILASLVVLADALLLPPRAVMLIHGSLALVWLVYVLSGEVL
jgi:hypothetical protein